MTKCTVKNQTKRKSTTPSMIRVLIIIGVFLFAGCEKSLLKHYPFEKGKVILMHSPIDLNGIKYFFPMGGLNVQPKDHGGFVLKNPHVFPANIPVFAVADGVVIRISYGKREIPPIEDAPKSSWYKTYDDHLIQLKVSETMIINYAHVTDFHPDFAAKLPDQKIDKEGRDMEVEVEVEVHEGDILGYVRPHGAMDFSISDLELQLNFLNPGRYPGLHIYSGNIFDYFEEGLSGEMEKFAFRKEPPRGGKIDYDVKGKIVGNWFLENTTSYVQWSRQLAIVYHDLFGDRITISDGSPMRDVPGSDDPGYPDSWWVKGNSPRPETIGISEGKVRYELIYPRNYRDLDEYIDELQHVAGIMLVQALENDRIRVEIFKGSVVATDFTSAAKIYVR
jgi:hypothetical protein